MPGAEEVDGDRLERYRAKRAFDQTPEPSGAGAAEESGAGAAEESGPARRFVVQKHDARRLHYDFRLEADGVLVSWAVPKGPSYDPRIKRLAVHVEDHPLDYRGFEGVIPGAQYGAGTVIVWDEGTYRNLTQRDRTGREVDVAGAVRHGHLSVWLEGTKLVGGWSLTRTGRQGDKEQWILVKRTDGHADPDRDVVAAQPDSVRSGRSLAQLAAGGTEEGREGAATWVPPMLAQLMKLSDFLPGGADGWRYERKLDGLRCVAVRNGGQVELWSRNHLSFNARFPEVVAALRALRPDRFTFDGEIVAYDAGRTSFSLLQQRGATAHPVYCTFDLLSLLGRDTTGLPLSDRQALLAQALEGGDGDVLSTVTGVGGDPAALLRHACADGWEGLIAKRVGSPYRPGRGSDWRKLKCQASQELVIGGWTDPSGSRSGFGALLVGYYDDAGDLRYAGKVGTGFSEQTLRDLSRALAARARDRPAFVDAGRVKGAHWVEPELVGAVAFTEWTADGRLRHPSFEGLRPDKPARDVRREVS